MKTKNDISTKGVKIFCLVMSSFIALTYTSVNAQVKYNPANELREANMGVERVARYYLPAYASRAGSNNETRWVQIDLGLVKKNDGIKLLPGVQGWGPAAGGFPSRFRLEVSSDADFKHSIMYEDYTLKEEFPNPDDQVCTFASKEAYGRYVRFTATQLRDNKLAMTKIMVLSDGKDSAEGCPATESNPNKDSHIELLTRPPRPQGEGVLAAGAIQPKDGFQYAFNNGADFICVGMYDFQIVDDSNIVLDSLSIVNRTRPWRG